MAMNFLYTMLLFNYAVSEVLFDEVKTLLLLSDTFPSLSNTNIALIQEDLREPDTFFISANRTLLSARLWPVSQQRLGVIAGKVDERGYRESEGMDALFGYIAGLVQTEEGIIVTDAFNECLRFIHPPSSQSNRWRTSTYAGKCLAWGSQDGKLLDARFDGPFDLIKQSNLIFLTDLHNRRLRQINMDSGDVTTIHQSSHYKPLLMVSHKPSNEFYVTTDHGILLINEGKESWLVGWGKGFLQREKTTFSNAKFRDPEAIDWLGDDILLITDHGTGSLKTINIAKKEVDTICPERSSRFVRGNIKACKFRNPLSLLVLKDTILIGDNGAVRSLDYEIFHDVERQSDNKDIHVPEVCDSPPTIPNADYVPLVNYSNGSTVYYQCTHSYTKTTKNSKLVCTDVNSNLLWKGEHIGCRPSTQLVTASVLAAICICTVIAIVVTAVKLRRINKQLEGATGKQVKCSTESTAAGSSNNPFSNRVPGRNVH